MIILKQGNLLKSKTEALVNTVNSVGYMGKGIALQFKKAYPENFSAYVKACRVEEVMPGKMLVFETGSIFNPKYIINFPTKRHWRGNSRLEDIESGLSALVQVVKELGLTSLAVPPLGCGLGGLDWKQVRPMIEQAFKSLPEVEVHLYEPKGAPDPRSMPIGTECPAMTNARALLLLLMSKYKVFEYRLTLLEIQKLAYFLQEAGESLKLQYEHGRYGPYAHNLNYLIDKLNGHYLEGYGDSQKPDVEINLINDAVEVAADFLKTDDHVDSCARLSRIAELIDGFQTPYGMELLATTHWVACHEPDPAKNADEAVVKIHEWSERKKQRFDERHIQVAWDQLVDEKWISICSTDAR